MQLCDCVLLNKFKRLSCLLHSKAQGTFVVLVAVLAITSTARGADKISTVRNALAPVMVRVDLDSTQTSASKVLEVASDYPGRLIVIGIDELPWKVAKYSSNKCQKLNEELLDIIKAIRSQNKNFELSVYGLPAQERGSISRSDATRINNKLSKVIDAIDVFVPHPSSVRTSERSVRVYFSDKLSDVAEFAGKRPICVEVNKTWRRWYAHQEPERAKQRERWERKERKEIEEQISDTVRDAYKAVRGTDHVLWDFDKNGVVDNKDWDRFLEKWDRWSEIKIRDRDGDGRPDWKDLCPEDGKKKLPGDCGCGNEDEDLNNNGVSDCIEPSPSTFVDPPSTYTIGEGVDLELMVSEELDDEDVSVVFRSYRSGESSEGIWIDYHKPYKYHNAAMDNVSPGFATAQALVRVNSNVVESVQHTIEFVEPTDDDDASDGGDDANSGNNGGGDSSDGGNSGGDSDGDSGGSSGGGFGGNAGGNSGGSSQGGSNDSSGSDDDSDDSSDDETDDSSDDETDDSSNDETDDSSDDDSDDSSNDETDDSSDDETDDSSNDDSDDSSNDDSDDSSNDETDDSSDDETDANDDEDDGDDEDNGDEGDSGDEGDIEDDDPFWSEAAPSSDTRFVYVSSSEGHDSNNGYSVDEPVRTLNKGKSRMRDGFPDRLLLKRGDVWNEGFEGWTLSGRSESEPMIIGAYGSAPDRPHLELTDERAMYLLGSPKHLWITSMRITAATPTWAQGILFHYGGSDGEDLLFEDLYIEGFSGNIMVDQTGSNQPHYKNMRFRRVVSVDAVTYQNGDLYTSTGTQGIFLSYTDGTLIEECILDHNGRSHDPDVEISGIFAHNLYIAADNKNFEMRGTISANAGSHGIKCMSGGEIRDCLFLRNPINVLLGHHHANPGGSVSMFEDNIILDSQAISSSLPRGDGIHLHNLKDSFVQNNIIAGMRSQNSGGKAVWVYIDNDNACDDVRVIDNTIVDWPNRGITVELVNSAPYDLKFKRNHIDTRGVSFMCYLEQYELTDGVVFQDNVYYYAESIPVFSRVGSGYWSYAQWLAAVDDTGSSMSPYVEGKWDGLSIESYQASIGKTPTLDAFISKARNQRRGDWNDKYTIQAVQTYCFEERDGIMDSH